MWKGLSGLFPRSDIEIIRKTDMDEVREHVTLRPSSSIPQSGSEANYKMVYSEMSDNEDHSQRSSSVGKSFYSDEEYSGFDQSGISRRSEMEESTHSNVNRGKLPSKMAKRQQQKMKQGIYSGEESVLAK